MHCEVKPAPTPSENMSTSGRQLEDATAPVGLSPASAGGAVQVRPTGREDYQTLARFMAGFANETRGEQFWLDRFRFWWDENPAYCEETPRGWILWARDQIKGHFGNIPIAFQLNGKIVTSFNSTSWRVMASHRNYSLNLLHRWSRCASDSILFNATPSEDAARIMQAVKFPLVPQGTSVTKSTIVVAPRRVLASRTNGKVFSSLAGAVGGPVLGLVQACKARLGRASQPTKVRLLTRADSAFDQLWARTRHRYAHTNVRSAAAIQWYCFGSEHFRKTLIGCFDGERLAGYAIITKGVRNAMNVAACADLWLDPDSPAALADLLRFSKTWADEEGLDIIEIPHFNHALGQQLSRLGLFQRTSAGEQPAYYKASSIGELNPAESYLVGLQGDRGI